MSNQPENFEDILNRLNEFDPINNLNNQISHLIALQQQQMAQQQFQAGLQQLLFELDQTARHLRGLREHDLLAAGLLAHAKLSAIQQIGVHPALLPSLENKRFFADTTAFFQQIWEELQQAPSLAQSAQKFLHNHHTYNSLVARLPRDAKTIRNKLRVDVKQNQLSYNMWNKRKYMFFSLSALALILVVVLGFYLGIVSKLELDGTFFFASSIAIFASVSLPLIWMQNTTQARNSLERSKASLSQLNQLFSDLEKFTTDKDGGQFLEQMLKQHPTLRG